MFKLPNSKLSPYLFQEPTNPAYWQWKTILSLFIFLKLHYIVFFQGDSDGDDDDMDDDTLSDWNLRKWFGIDNTYSVSLCLFFSLVNNTLIKIFLIFFF